MAEKPILFSGAMVRAIIDGRKTQTRRALKRRGKHTPSIFNDGWADAYVMDPGNAEWREREIPIKAGNTLWVKETFSIKSWDDDGAFWITYAADNKTSGALHPDDESYLEKVCERLEKAGVKTDDNIESYINIPPALLSRPSIFMLRAFSRITLKVTAVKVERLQDISEEDAKAEGVTRQFMTICEDDGTSYTDAFAELWEQINGPGSWDANPWVAAYSFERVK